MQKFTGVLFVFGLLTIVLAALSGPNLAGLLFVVLSVLCGLVAMINELVMERKELES